MRHPYVGDVGDFGKYGLLRALSSDHDAPRLGVVWYLSDATEHNNDGKHDGYLKRGTLRERQSFRECDPELYDRMRDIREKSKLDLEMVQDGSVLPKSTRFHAEPLPVFRGRVVTPDEYASRWTRRQRWHEAALRKVAQASLVFTDPDNGINFRNEPEIKRTKPSHKHSYWYELTDYLQRGQSVVAYHHLGRQKGGHEVHIRDCLAKIGRAGHEAWAVHYRRGTGRAYFVIPSQADGKLLWERSSKYAAGWQAHASLIENRPRTTR